MSFFFKATATTEIYTLSLHDALPIFGHIKRASGEDCSIENRQQGRRVVHQRGNLRSAKHAVKDLHVVNCAGKDRKSTRLNSSHVEISYAVFCLKKKKKKNIKQKHQYT